MLYHLLYVKYTLILITTLYQIIHVFETLRADFSQGDQSNFGDNAGKQCVAMSLTAIIFRYIKPHIDTWDSPDLNNILCLGNCLYDCIKCSVKKDLLLTDVPAMVSLNEKTYNLTYSGESLSGQLFMTDNNGPYISLKNAFTEIFFGGETNCECSLLTIDCNTVAVFNMLNNSYRIFDSHSRDMWGMPSFSGTCVLLIVDGLENLVAFFKATSYRGTCVPFEMKGVLVNEACIGHNQDFEQLVNNQNAQGNCYKKRKCANESNEKYEIGKTKHWRFRN